MDNATKAAQEIGRQLEIDAELYITSGAKEIIARALRQYNAALVEENVVLRSALEGTRKEIADERTTIFALGNIVRLTDQALASTPRTGTVMEALRYYRNTARDDEFSDCGERARDALAQLGEG